MHDKKR